MCFHGFSFFLYFRLVFLRFPLARCLFCAAFVGGFSGVVPVWGCVFVLVLWGAMWDPFGDIWEDGGRRSDLRIISTTGRNTYTNLVSRHTSELFLPIQMDSACEVLEGIYVKRCANGSDDYTKYVWQEKGNGPIEFYYPNPSGGWITIIQREKGGPVSFKTPDGAMKVLVSLEVPQRTWMHASMNEWAPAYFSTVELFNATAAI